jgi:5-methylcytosine-specific restriction protein B
MTSPEPPEPEPPILDLLRICSEFAGAVTEANLQFGPNHLDFIRSFVVSLATRGFALLTGLSGSGKTRIAIAFGQWLGKDRYKVIAVRPDWTGPEPLLGYEDALLTAAKDGRRAWHVPEVFEFILRAVRDPVHPYLLVLDEMNLAHVERYFADLLSGMESGEGVLHNVVEEGDGLWRIPAGGRKLLPVPPNLLVVGTVNVDETTYMFSPKVLDRANTLEFRVGSEDLRVDALPPSPLAAGQDALVRGFLAIATDRLFQSAHPASNRDLLAAKLVDLHKGLRTYGFEFGHRVFSEAMRFAALLEAAGETSQWRALDLQVKQKVLPRMHGTARRLTAPLNLVGRFCLDLTVAASATGGAMDAEGEPDSAAALADSFDKVRRMMRSLRANQFASFSE